MISLQSMGSSVRSGIHRRQAHAHHPLPMELMGPCLANGERFESPREYAVGPTTAGAPKESRLEHLPNVDPRPRYGSDRPIATRVLRSIESFVRFANEFVD